MDYIVYKYGIRPPALSFTCAIQEGGIAMYEKYTAKFFTYQDGNLIGN